MFEVYVGDKDIQEVQRHAVGVSRPGVSAIGKRLLLSCSPTLLLSCSPAVPLWPHPFSFEDISDHNEACCSSSSFALRYPARNSFPVLDLPISRCLRVLSPFARRRSSIDTTFQQGNPGRGSKRRPPSCSLHSDPREGCAQTRLVTRSTCHLQLVPRIRPWQPRSRYG